MSRVLIVENSVTMQQMLCEVVRGLGHEAEVATTAGDAMGKVLSWRPQALILDLQLDGGSRGETVYKRLRADPQTSALPVIACTVQRQQTLRRNLGEDSSAQDPRLYTLFKPFALAQVVDVLKQALEA